MRESTGGAAGQEGLFAALKNSLASLLAIGKTRAELLVVELEEEKLRLMSLWAKAIGAAFMLALGIIMAVFCLALALWEYRVWVFGLFAVLFGLIAWGLIATLRQEARQPSPLFRGSLGALDDDLQHLRQRGSSAE